MWTVAEVPQGARVLDVGGGMGTHPRADVVLDMLPPPPGFKKEWVQMNLAEFTPFPFPDKSFDFVVCSGTLEDISNPVWVCREIARVGKAGYIMVPTRKAESTRFPSGNWRINSMIVGWEHHRWFIENRDGVLTFIPKWPLIQVLKEFQIPRDIALKDYCLDYYWKGTFKAKEIVFTSADEALQDLKAFYEKTTGKKAKDRIAKLQTPTLWRRFQLKYLRYKPEVR